MTAPELPRAFLWRRLHSFLGLWLVLFLLEHLLTNSQAALFFGDDGYGFIHGVNFIHSLPYLPVIEGVLLGIPMALHAAWGVRYLLTSKSNSGSSDGSTPALGRYPRNRAFTWQRITSWILLFAVIAHVFQMRFLNYPVHANQDGHRQYIVRLSLDRGLYTVAERLGVGLYDRKRIDQLKDSLPDDQDIDPELTGFPALSFDGFFEGPKGENFDSKVSRTLNSEAQDREAIAWVEALEERPLASGQVAAAAPDFGTASLLIVRETFKMPLMVLLYTMFVLAAVFHAFNGLWTCMITWGVTLTERSQLLMRRLSVSLMVALCLLGWAAIWGTYWINLRF